MENAQTYLSYQKSIYTKMLIYFFIVIITQFGINIASIVSTCGGSVSQNVASAALLTFIPWILIFGALIVALIIFPGWKSAFSNVIGYFVVSGQANQLLSDLLVNTDVNQQINAATNGDDSKRSALEAAASAIVKLSGNMSLLINQIVPENFMKYWALLTPLMKEQYTNTDASMAMQQKLLDIVVLRDNIGEALWYVYAAILLTSVVQYKIATQGCSPDLVSMNVNQQLFQQSQQEIQDQTAAAQSKIYSQ